MKLYKALRRLFSLLVGIVFFIAGTLKLMDPVGAGLVVEEYFKFFGTFGLMNAAEFVGVAMALFETLLGAAMITGVWRKVIAWIGLGVIFLFTILTLILWIKNPAMDCGCFGEAIHLTHGQSLVKNLILLAMWSVACFPMRFYVQPKKIKYATFGVACVSSVLFLIYSLIQIPLLDLTSMYTGVQIGTDVNLDQVPLSLSNSKGEYFDEYLQDSSNFVISFYDPTEDKVRDAQKVLDNAAENGLRPVLILSEPLGCGIDSTCFFADRRDILSLNRSNGGATYISDGVITRKWAASSLPDKESMQKIAESDSVEILLGFTAKVRLEFQAYLLYVFAVMLLL